MPNAAEYRARIDTEANPVQSGLERLTTSLLGIHERKLARARQAEMDRMAMERDAREAQQAEDERNLKLFAVQKALEAERPSQPLSKTFEESQAAEIPGKAPMMTPDTPEERAAFEPPTPGPSITIGGQTLQAPSAAEIQARQDEDFARKLVQERELSGARTEGGLITVPEGFGELSGKQIPAGAFDALIRAQMGGGSSARPFEALFGGKPAMIDPETRQPIPGMTPIPPRPSGGGAPRRVATVATEGPNKGKRVIQFRDADNNVVDEVVSQPTSTELGQKAGIQQSGAMFDELETLVGSLSQSSPFTSPLQYNNLLNRYSGAAGLVSTTIKRAAGDTRLSDLDLKQARKFVAVDPFTMWKRPDIALETIRAARDLAAKMARLDQMESGGEATPVPSKYRVIEIK